MMLLVNHLRSTQPQQFRCFENGFTIGGILSGIILAGARWNALISTLIGSATFYISDLVSTARECLE